MESYQENEDEQINSNSKLGKLILKVNNMHKKPLLDNSLSEVLDLFLHKLRQSEDFLINGIFQINFAEAALLLQSSAFVYCKKVDLLWDSTNQCQKRMISFDSDENKEELKRLDEREKKYKRKRRVVEVINNEKGCNEIENFNTDWNDLNEFKYLNCEKDSRLFSGWHKKMVVNWDLQPISRECRTFAEKYSHFRSSNNAIYDKDHDDEFVVHTNKLESVIALEDLFLQQKPIFEKFSFELYTELYLVPNFLQYHQLKYDDLDKYSEKFEKIVSSYRDRLVTINNNGNNSIKSSTPELRQNPQKLRRISVTSTVVSKLSRADFDKIYSQECQVNLLRLSVDDLSRLCRLPVDELRSYSEPQHSKTDFNIENFQENSSADNKITINADDISCTPNALVLEEISNCDHDDIVHSTEDVASSAMLQSIPDLAQNDGIQDTEVSEIIPNNDINGECENALVITGEKCRVSSRTHENLKKVMCCEDMLEIDDEDHIPQKKRRLSKAALKRLATGITVDLKEFSLFFAVNYTPEEGEGQVEIPEFDIDDPIDSSSKIDDEEDIPLSQLTETRVCTQDSGYESRFHDADDVELDIQSPISASVPLDDDIEIPVEACTANLETCRDSNGPEVSSPDVDFGLPNEEKPLHERVYEWKQYMSEIFKKSSSKDFDIHEYGSNIMQCLDSDRPMRFGEMVSGKSSAEVTRYFISALQLANTSNVEICGAQSGELSNDTFSLKLITSDRYYDRLKTYVAPSEENFRERLESAQKLNKRRKHESTSSGSGIGLKRSRYE